MKMAFPYVKVIFEIGHEASVRNKRTPEGFTHDWELFVRGADNSDIQCFIDKVVFHLHDTFQNPKRVVKEPPYVVKESGYAGFPLPIDIYIRNNDEPRKIRFKYELELQDRGLPPISRVTRETYIFSPSEDFRRKLIKGGGISVLTLDGAETKNAPSSSAISKQKSISNTNRLPSPPPKKNKKEDMKLNNTFATLFGSPIQPSKLPLTTKSTSQKVSSSDKSQVKNKTSPHYKEEKKDKDKEREKEKKKSKESTEKVKKDKDKKEKTKESSDKSKSQKSSSKTDKKESSHHEKIKEKSNDNKIDKKDSKDKSKREDKVKEKNKEKSHKDEKSYNNEPKIVKQDINKQNNKPEFNDQEKKKHKSSPEPIKVKSDKKLDKSEKSSKTHKSHKEHKKRDKRDKEDKLNKKEEKSTFVEQDTSFKHLDVPHTITSIEEFPKTKDDIPECSPPPKANSSRVHEPEPESEDEFPSEDSEPSYRPEVPKAKEPEPSKKKLSPENSFTKKKKRKKKERDSEEPKQRTSRPEIGEQMHETCSDISRSPSPNSKFTDEYINSLKYLQHKIMSLEDEDLQRVVTVIAETGHYEVTTKTFDFDLCALNETTVRKLQELIT